MIEYNENTVLYNKIIYKGQISTYTPVTTSTVNKNTNSMNLLNAT